MKRKYIKYLIFLVIIILLIRFINSPWKWGDKDLGDKYVLMEDGRFTSIVYCNKVPYNGTGLEVLPDYINDYDFNKNFIIAKRIDLKSDKEDYWIIDKRHKINIDSCMTKKVVIVY